MTIGDNVCASDVQIGVVFWRLENDCMLRACVCVVTHRHCESTIDQLYLNNFTDRRRTGENRNSDTNIINYETCLHSHKNPVIAWIL